MDISASTPPASRDILTVLAILKSQADALAAIMLLHHIKAVADHSGERMCREAIEFLAVAFSMLKHKSIILFAEPSTLPLMNHSPLDR